MTIISGEKIVLRPFREADAEPLLKATQNPTMRRLTGTQMDFTLEQTQRYVNNFATADDRVGFVIADPETLAALGEVVILSIDEDNRCANIRISLFDEADFGKGYGTEAMRLMVNHGFQVLKLHRIGLDVFDFNPRAIRVYEKIGFKQEGKERDCLFFEGKYHSAILMSILEDEWQGL